MKKLAVFFALALCAALAGCASSAPVQGGGSAPEPSGSVSEPPTQRDEPMSGIELEPSGSKNISAVEGADVSPVPEAGQAAMVYIGTKAEGFTDYPIVYDGDLTPEILIQGIADLTGWDLTLAESVTSGKGGMGVCLSNESALFTGPPDPQREPFFVFGAEQLAEMILDSIQKTLQMGFTGEGGDPDALDIWYFMEDGQSLEIPALGLSWTAEQPYQWTERISEEG
ncbi:MAG: hypothetical protein HFH26_15135 [Clostridiaceae bacterium]|nr:hypothetical protein [Clostridiaceae bacterium]